MVECVSSEIEPTLTLARLCTGRRVVKDDVAGGGVDADEPKALGDGVEEVWG